MAHKTYPKSKTNSSEGEQTFHLLFENHPIPMWVYDLKTLAFIEVNDAALEKYGYTHDEFLILTIKDIRPEEDAARLMNNLEQKRPALQHSGEWRHRLKNGQVIDVEITSHTLKFEGREAALVMAQDITERKVVENALVEKEKKYRELFEGAPDAIFLADIESGRIIDANPAASRMLQKSHAEIVGMSQIELHSVEQSEDSRQLFESHVRAALEGNPLEPIEYSVVRSDGVIIPVEILARKVSVDGQTALQGVFRDITERKRAEEFLAVSEAELRALFASMQDVVLVIDHDGVYRKIAPTNPGLLVKPPDELLGKNLRDIFPAEQAEFFINTIQLVLKKQQTKHIEYEMTIGEQKMWFATSISPMNHENTLWVARDITGRKHIEEEALLQNTALNAAANAIAITNLDGAIKWVNPAFSALTGYALEEAVGKNPSRLIKSGLHDQSFYKSMWDTILSGDVWHGELTNRRKDGSLYYEEQTITPMKNAEGSITHFIAIKQDISARKQAEEALRESEEKYRRLFDNANLGIFQSTPEGKAISVNYAFAHMFGYDSPEDAIKSIKNVATDVFADPNRRAEIMRLMAENPDLRTFENVYRRKDDSTFVGSLNSMPIKDSDGSLIRIEGIIEDITERKQAEEAIRQRLAEQSILHQASQSLLSVHLDPETIYMTLHQAVVQIMPCEVFTIILNDENRGDYHAVYLYDMGHCYPAQRIPRGQGLSGKVIANGETLFIHDNLQENVPAIHFGAPQSVRSILAVPLRKNNETVGMVSAQSYQPNAYNQRHRVLLETLAAQITTIIENARLLEAERKHRQMSDALRDALSAGASMSASLDFATILDRLLEAIERVMPFEGGSIMLVQPEKQKISIAKMRGYKTLGKQLIDKISKFSFDIASVENLRWILNNKQPLVIPDIEQYPAWVRVPESSFIRSWAGAPIIVNNEVIALFSLDSTIPNFFTSEHVELLRAFTGQASLALQNARLFDETARRAQEFASLYETSNALSAENELNTMLQVIVEHAKKLLGSASSGMYLYLSETRELELTVDTTHYIPLGTRLQLDEGVAGRVAQTHQPLRIADYSTWEGRSPAYDGTSIRAVLEVPMLYGGELIGVLTAGEVGDSERKFTEADERLLSLFASQAAGAIHSARLREQTARRLDQLQALHTIDRAISSSFALHPILNTLISQTISQLGVDAADVLLFHPHLQTLEYIAGQGFRARAIEQTQLRLGECFAGRAAFERRTIHVPDLPQTGSNFTRTSILEGEGFLEYYGVPLIAKGEIKGVLEVFHRTPLPRNPEWLDFLETLAGQAAITIDQTQLFDNLQRANLELIIAYDATIEGWSHAMDLRDKETEGHTLRVTEMTMALAKAMGINEKEMPNIRRGALLHDIGKMGIPDNILFKEGNLTDEEWVVMRQHPTFSYKMLLPIKYLRQSLDIPYCHHEKWDGSGYPRGLKGEQIPLAARIFAIVDVWDAVIIDRPYRKAWTRQKALKYIREQSGKHFEPAVVKAFLNLFDTKKTGVYRPPSS